MALIKRVLRQISMRVQGIHQVLDYGHFVRDVLRYGRMPGAEPIDLKHIRPMLADKQATFDAHYLFQATWAFRHIYGRRIAKHFDVGSDIRFLSLLSAICPVVYVDIRPVNLGLTSLNYCNANILALPFKNDSIHSLSCLHVLEHIGLGRYGDQLDPLGTKKGAHELIRVLAMGGELYVSLPVGKPRLFFNAHRVHSPDQVLEYFGKLQLSEINWVDDEGTFHESSDWDAMRNSTYACGLFWLRK